MKKIYFLTSILLLVLTKTYAQHNVSSDTTAIGLGATSADPAYKFKYNGQSVAYYGLGWYSSAAAPVAYLSGYSGITLFTQSGPRLSITGNGNVGIGTTSPSYKLDVNGAGQFLNTVFLKSNSVNSAELIMNKPSGGYYDIVSNNSSFQVYNSTTSVPIINADASDNVGIGTIDTKGYKLAINGSAIATSMTVKLYANWPDYVFKPTYKLPSLTEVKSYIDKNQHLPEIPSAIEMAKNGIDLGDMNTKLLKKVEELTLYLIEKDEKDKEQQREIDQLKKQNLLINKLRRQLEFLSKKDSNHQ